MWLKHCRLSSMEAFTMITSKKHQNIGSEKAQTGVLKIFPLANTVPTPSHHTPLTDVNGMLVKGTIWKAQYFLIK